MKVAIVFSGVFPYRTAVFDLLPKGSTVIYSCKREPNRTWAIGDLNHAAVFLKERFVRLGWEKFFHFNPEVFGVLKALDPDVVILYGDALTQQLAGLWAFWNHRPIVYWTDGWSHTEKNKSCRQKTIEKFIVKYSASFIATGIKTRDYLVSLGAEKERIFISRIVR